MCDEEIKKLRHQMHGRLRQELRSTINHHTARREMLRELGKTRQVLKSVLGRLGGRKHQDPLFLGAIRESDTMVECTPETVHTVMTAHFEQWYAMPPHYTTDQLHTGQWQDTLKDFASFYAAVQHTKVPEPLCHLIYRAIMHTPQVDTAHSRMTDIFNTPPSFEEFVAHIRTLTNNSGPGPSGCSYNMIKSWPEVTKKAAYDCLAQFWTDKHIPTHWKWRWLVPAPKKPTDTPLIADLRPLMLSEATRKAWISLILSKIRSVTKSLNMFNSAQHGYVPGRGTMSA